MLDEIYNSRVLELAANIPRLGRLAAPDATAKALSRLCGSTVTIDLSLRDGRVSDFAHDVRACALGQASSSLMARHIIGATPEELLALRDTMTQMLKAGGPPPSGKWVDFAALEPVKDYKARHASTLLTFDAVADALQQIATRKAKGAAAASAAL
jgi:NifU-like protein involved in Fe-S cluster formation